MAVALGGKERRYTSQTILALWGELPLGVRIFKGLGACERILTF
jgi:hypothetical protein